MDGMGTKDEGRVIEIGQSSVSELRKSDLELSDNQM